MDKLTFQSKEYKYRWINTKYGYFLVSSCELEDELIDEMVFFYVPQTILEADETFLTEYADRNVFC